MRHDQRRQIAAGRQITASMALAFVWLGVMAVASLGAGGRVESTDGPDREGSTPQSQMRRLLVIGAGLGTDGGRRVDVDLPAEFQNQPPPAGSGREFTTDFSKAVISFGDVIAGGPPKDGIPSLDRPSFVDQRVADEWIGASEPVIVYEYGNEARIYPLQILTWHEIVNDTVGGRPVTVTFCPLCNTSVVFDRTFDGNLLEFGVSGRLIFSNMLMYDRQSETWWIQATGRGAVGEHAGQQLELLPSILVSWNDARRAFPNAQVLSRDTGFQRPYGRNPYTGYDSSAQPFLYRGPAIAAEEGAPLRRVLAVYHGDESFAVDYDALREERFVEVELAGRRIVVLWQPGTASALDAPVIADGRDVGTANAFYAYLDDQPIAFRIERGRIVDSTTGTAWDATGSAVSGPRSGARLDAAPSIQHFYFSWRAFHTD